MPDAALVEAIRAVLTASPFHGEGHRKVWARLRVDLLDRELELSISCEHLCNFCDR